MKIRILLLTLTVMIIGCSGSDDSSPAIASQDLSTLKSESEHYAGKSLSQIAAEPAAMELAGELFQGYCASCHGMDATGTKGIPDLLNGAYDYGTSENAIRETIMQGRHSVMPVLGTTLGEVDLGLLVGYVMSFSGSKFEQRYVQSARRLYDDNCTVCHGETGQGNTELGIPDLTDTYWQHGSSKMNVRLNITRGIEAQCPPHADLLTSIEVDLLTAYVKALTQ
jgi:cytochrome c oxidase cbb3-type subunit 3